jgi:PTS system mannose-specific IIA component
VIGIVIVAHGGLAAELKRATEHVVGPQAAMVAISIGPEDDRSARTAEICDAADAVDAGDGRRRRDRHVWRIALQSQPPGLSPSNRRILTGVNLPMMVKLVKSRNLPVEEAVSRAEEAGRRYINSFEGGPE